MEGLPSDLLAFAHWCNAFVAQGTFRVYHFIRTIWTNPNSSLFWVYFATFLFWAGLAFRHNYQGRGIGNFFRFCFPRETYLHRSTATDLQLFFLNRFLWLPAQLLKGFGALGLII